MPPAETKTALDAGYRSIDTATAYDNEAAVGGALSESGIAADELFVTTKLWNSSQGHDETLRAFDTRARRRTNDGRFRGGGSGFPGWS